MRNHYNVQCTTTLINVWYKGIELCAFVDTADLPLLETHKVQWYAQPAKAPAGKYYVWTKFWDRDAQRNRTVALHRFIMGEPPGMDVHHVDNNGLNCRRSNLEICTHKENKRKSARPRDWDAFDQAQERRRLRSLELKRVRQVVQSTGYSRAYVWKVRRGMATNQAIQEALCQ
jgi:hypothetical protein